MSTAESLVVSPKLAVRMKELGFPQELNKGDWYLYEGRRGAWLVDTELRMVGMMDGKTTKLPHAEEILRGLPKHFSFEKYGCYCLRIEPFGDGKWSIEYRGDVNEKYSDEEGRYCDDQLETSLANAAAAMWCYLKENNLLSKA